MSRRLIIWVAGQKPKPPPAQYHAQLWRCLLQGVWQADPPVAKALMPHAKILRLVPWNLPYYGVYRDIEQDIPHIKTLLRKAGPTQEDMREATTWRVRLTWLMYHLADSMHWVMNWIPDPQIRAVLQESERYFHNRKGIAQQIRNLLISELRTGLDQGAKILLIGHSLGSVIAYDALWQLSRVVGYRAKVDLFVTLGSPLGVKFVQKRLLGAQEKGAMHYPANLRRWVNIAAVGELRAIDRAMRNDFKPMLDLELIDDIEDHSRGVFTYYRDENGLNVHRSYGYLVHPVTGKIIADWLRGK